MFGSMFRMRPKAGEEQAVEKVFRRWADERRPKVAGAVASYVLKPRNRPGELLGMAVFDTEENYIKNANDPEQDRWYRELRSHLEADPEWNDGDIILSLS